MERPGVLVRLSGGWPGEDARRSIMILMNDLTKFD
jgi:hypothetical protein